MSEKREFGICPACGRSFSIWTSPGDPWPPFVPMHQVVDDRNLLGICHGHRELPAGQQLVESLDEIPVLRLALALKREHDAETSITLYLRVWMDIARRILATPDLIATLAVENPRRSTT